MPSTPKIVDLRAYRADQSRRRLPLFDPPEADPPPPGTRATLRFEPAVTPLSARQVTHRARMLRHLGGYLSGASAGRSKAPR